MIHGDTLKTQVVNYKVVAALSLVFLGVVFIVLRTPPAHSGKIPTISSLHTVSGIILN